MKYWIHVCGRAVEVEIGGDAIFVDGRPVQARIDVVNGTDHVMLDVDGVRRSLSLTKSENGWLVSAAGETAAVEVETERSRLLARAGEGQKGGRGSGLVRAPMPGLVLRVDVSVGDDVAIGDGLVVLEAMKMENVIKSAVAGKVAKVHVDEGVAVEKAALLVSIEEVS